MPFKRSSAERQSQMTAFFCARGQYGPDASGVRPASPRAVNSNPLAGTSNQMFVLRYQVQSPEKVEITAFLREAVKESGGSDE